MASTAHLSVTVPKSVLYYLSSEMQSSGRSKSAVVSEILRAYFEPEDIGAEAVAEYERRVDEHEKRIAWLEGLAQEAGAG